MPNSLTLNGIIDVSVELAPIVPGLEVYDALLIMGDSTAISTTDRIKEFYEMSEIASAGFQTTDPEYLAAQLYFGQTPRPRRVFIGRVDASIVGSVEDLTVALTDARAKNGEWYAVTFTTDMSNDFTTYPVVKWSAVCDYVEGMVPEGILGLSITDAVDTANFNTFVNTVGTAGYSRTYLQYSSVERAADFSKTPVAAVFGWALGNNTEGRSAYTLAYKQPSGISPETNINQVKLNQILDGWHSNVYVKQAIRYNLLRQGNMVNGQPFDEILFLDMLIYDVKSAVMDLLVRSPKVPQTEGGISQLSLAISQAVEPYVSRQFLLPGTWRGPQVFNLAPGDVLQSGYLVQFESLDTQSVADRAARKAPLCYLSLKLAGAIEHVTIVVNVDR
jgi:hypothetical protein